MYTYKYTGPVLALVKLASMTPSEFEILSGMDLGVPPVTSLPRVSLANELAALNALVDELQRVVVKLRIPQTQTQNSDTRAMTHGHGAGDNDAAGQSTVAHVHSNDLENMSGYRVQAAYMYRRQASAIVQSTLKHVQHLREQTARECLSNTPTVQWLPPRGVPNSNKITTGTKMEEFYSWIKSAGGSHAATTRGYGLATAEEGLCEGDAAVCIPKDLLISVAAAYEDAKFAEAVESVQGMYVCMYVYVYVYVCICMCTWKGGSLCF
jgi:hypothetical protein